MGDCRISPRDGGLETTSFAETRAARSCSRIVLGVVMVMSVQLVYMAVAMAPPFREMFEEMGPGVALSGITATVLSPAFPAVIVILALAGIAKEFAIKNHQTTLITNGVHLVLLFAMQGLLVAGLFRPLFTLMDALSA